MKTRCLFLLLCLFLALTSSALAAPGDAQLYSESTEGLSMTAWQGGALVLTSKGLEKVAPDGSSTLLFPAPQEMSAYDTLIYGDGATLYALDKASGALSTWDLKTGALTLLCQLNWDGLGLTMDGYTFAAEVSSLYVADGMATLLLVGDDYLTASLQRFSLEDGARTPTGVERLTSVTPYQDGKLLGSTYDTGAPAGSQSRLLRIDPVTGNAEDAGPLPDGAAGLAYDAESGYFYCLSASELHRGRVGEATECVAYIPSNAPYISMTSADRQPQTALLSGGLFASLDYGVLTVRNADPQYKPSRTLRISGGSSDDAYRAFTREHPEIPVIFEPVTLTSAEDVMRAMVGGDGADIYVLPVSSTLYAPLIEKGYLSDLTQSETIRSLVERMYPALAEGLMQGGKIFAVPSSMYATTLGYSPYVLEQLGLTEDDLPKTLPEFLEFVGRWDDEFAEEHPTLSLFTESFDMSEAKLLFFDRLLSQYESTLRLRGEEISFDTPLFRELLAALEGANLPELAESIFDVDSGVSRAYTIFDDSAKPTALFDFYYSAYVMDYNLDQGYEPLLLPLSQDTPALLDAYMEVYVVNASSENADLAVAYLETVANNLGDGLTRTLLPDVNEPVENPNMVENIQEGEAALKEAEERGDEESAAVLREQLAYTQKYRYAISPENIEMYRNVADSLTLPTASAVYGDYAQDLLKRYLTGQLDADGFIRQLQQKLRMAQMEQIG